MSVRTDTLVLERCLKILSRLAAGRECTVDELYRMFDGRVSRRTLERDMLRLSAANVPIYDRSGAGRERIWSLDSNYRGYIPTLLGAEEVAAAILLSELSKIVQHTPFADGVVKLQDRLRREFPLDAVRSLSDGEASPFFILSGGVVDYRPHSGAIRDFLRAIAAHRRCRILYRKHTASAATNIVLEPYFILLYAEALYGVGYSLRHSSIVTLPFHRMRSLELLAETFERSRDVDWQALFADRIGIVGAKHEAVEVTIRFYPPVSSAIAERTWHRSQSLETETSGTLILRMKVVVTKELLAWILRWQKFAEVLSPQELREQAMTALTDTLRRYRGL